MPRATNKTEKESPHRLLISLDFVPQIQSNTLQDQTLIGNDNYETNYKQLQSKLDC